MGKESMTRSIGFSLAQVWRPGAVLLLVLLAAALLPGAARAQDRVLIVHSYHQQMRHVQDINAGVIKALTGSGAQVETIYMDTKRKSSPQWMAHAGAMARAKLESFKPQVVITVDDNAQEYFARHYVGEPSPQFIFCAVDLDIAHYGFPASNVTGVLYQPDLTHSVELLLRIKPGLKTLAVLGDDSPSSWAVAARLKQQTAEPMKVVSMDLVSSFAQWKQAVRGYQDKVDAIAVILYHRLYTGGHGGAKANPEEVMAWTLKHSNKPTVGFFDFVILDGVLCGVVWSGLIDGLAVGRMARAMLQGRSAGDMPPRHSPGGQAMLNLKTAEKLGIRVPFEAVESVEKVIR